MPSLSSNYIRLAIRRWLLTLMSLALVGSCSSIGTEVDDGLPRRDRPPQPVAGVEATGPIEVLATGSGHGSWWRFSIHPSTTGWCTLLETGDGSGGSRCGGLGPPSDESIYNDIGWGTDANLASVFGFTTDEVAAAEIETRDGRSIPAHVIEVDEEGFEMFAVLAFASRNTSFQSITSVDADGEVIDVTDMTLPPVVIVPDPDD